MKTKSQIAVGGKKKEKGVGRLISELSSLDMHKDILLSLNFSQLSAAAIYLSGIELWGTTCFLEMEIKISLRGDNYKKWLLFFFVICEFCLYWFSPLLFFILFIRYKLFGSCT